MFGLGTLANAPVSIVTGFLFTLACRAPGLAVARVYIWEALGSAAGGIGITLWLAAAGQRNRRSWCAPQCCWRLQHCMLRAAGARC